MRSSGLAAGWILIGVVALAGCASVRTPSPVGEVPRGDYEVRVLSALAPTRHADGEVVAAVLYTRPGGPRVDVLDEPGHWLTDERIGRGTGDEHRRLVRDPANYTTVALTGPDGSPLGYAVLHRRGVRASVQSLGSRAVLVLSVRDFLDQNYIQPDRDSRNGRGARRK